MTLLATPTLERVAPHDGPNESWLALHVVRYDFASHYARPTGRLLDIACGSGHGTALLAERLPHVECVGVDVSSEAIADASVRYRRTNNTFICSDGMSYRDDDRFDTIVSLETIEHLDSPSGFVHRLVSMLRPRGRLIASVPSTPSTDANPFHRHDFTEASFRRLFADYSLREVASIRLVDPFANTPAFSQGRIRRPDVLRSIAAHYLAHPMSLVRRLAAVVQYGFENRYITTAWELTDR